MVVNFYRFYNISNFFFHSWMDISGNWNVYESDYTELNFVLIKNVHYLKKNKLEAK